MPRRPAPATDTRERILDAARRIFVARVELAATLAEVARDAGVSRATVHRHFGSREELLEELDVRPEPGSRERALSAAIELLARDGLERMAMDEVAARAGISRASLYRLFPGKSALFAELVRVYSPLEPIAATVTELQDQPPEVVMPAVARAAAKHLAGRAGLVRALIFEVSSPSGLADTARDLAIERLLGPLAAYVLKEMAAGRLRAMHPLLAIQAFAGPIIFHLVLREVTETRLGFDTPVEEVATQLAEIWVAAMRPTEEGK